MVAAPHNSLSVAKAAELVVTDQKSELVVTLDEVMNNQITQPTLSAVVAEPTTPQSIQEVVAQMTTERFGKNQVAAVNYIVQHESGWNPDAINRSSGAFGLFQALNKPGMTPGTSVKKQIDWGLNYIADRYATPAKAVSFWKTHHWY